MPNRRRVTILRNGASRDATAPTDPSGVTGLVRGLFVAPAITAGKLWQDTGKTTAADADEEPVRVAEPMYGLSGDMTAPADGNRPLLNSEGSGRWTIYGTAAEDRHLLFASSYTPAGACSFFGAFSHNTVTGDYCHLAGNVGAQSSTVGWHWTDEFRITGINAVTIASKAGVMPAAGNHVYEANRDGSGNWFLRIDGGSAIALTAGTPDAFQAVNAFGMGFVDAANATGNRAYGYAIVDGAITAAHRTGLTNFLKTLAGVA